MEQTSPQRPQQQMIDLGTRERMSETEIKIAREWFINNAAALQLGAERDGLAAVVREKQVEIDALRARVAELEAHACPTADGSEEADRAACPTADDGTLIDNRWPFGWTHADAAEAGG